MSARFVPSEQQHFAKKSTVSRDRSHYQTNVNEKLRDPVNLILLPENETEQNLRKLSTSKINNGEIIDENMTVDAVSDEIQLTPKSKENHSPGENFELISSKNPVLDLHENPQSPDGDETNDGRSANKSWISISDSEPHSFVCSCQCEKEILEETNDRFTDEFLAFEQALKQNYSDQIIKSTKNLKIDTLKEKHEQLMSFYQKQVHKEKISREQQTISTNRCESETQTCSFEENSSLNSSSKDKTKPIDRKSAAELVDLTEDDDENSSSLNDAANLNKILTNSANLNPITLLNDSNMDPSVGQPQLTINQDNNCVRLNWILTSSFPGTIDSYEIYAKKNQSSAQTTAWKKIGSVRATRSTMSVTLKDFQINSQYAFAVRALSTNNRIGPFSEVRTIFTEPNRNQALCNSHSINQSV